LGDGRYQEWDESTRLAWLTSQLGSKRPLIHKGEWKGADDSAFSPEAREVLDTFACISRQGPGSLSAYVISQASTASDVLAVLLLQKDAGVEQPLRVVPLFETLDDLNNAEGVMQQLWSNAAYRGRIGGKQEIMVGYSDSAKDAGRLAASWAQYERERARRRCGRLSQFLPL
jgi:phosphoenolpyruvate carboxylase